MKHTKEPWTGGKRMVDGWGLVGLWGADGTQILGSEAGWDGGYHQPSEEDEQRILACVNALAGIEDPPAFMEAVRQYHREMTSIPKDLALCVQRRNELFVFVAKAKRRANG